MKSYYGIQKRLKGGEEDPKNRKLLRQQGTEKWRTPRPTSCCPRGRHVSSWRPAWRPPPPLRGHKDSWSHKVGTYPKAAAGCNSLVGTHHIFAYLAPLNISSPNMGTQWRCRKQDLRETRPSWGPLQFSLSNERVHCWVSFFLLDESAREKSNYHYKIQAFKICSLQSTNGLVILPHV